MAGWGLPASVTITITPTPDPPAFTSQPLTSTTERISYHAMITAADPDPGDSRTFSAATLPGWLTLHDHGNGTAELTGTAALADVGPYPISLTARDSAGLSASQTFTLTVRPLLPNAPGNLAVAAISPALVRLSWDDLSTDEFGFAIERRENEGSWVRVTLVSRNSRTFIDTGRTCNTRYDYRVAALGSNGSSPPSNVAGLTITDCTLVAPEQLDATAPTTNTLLLRWIDRNENETGFRIERSANAVTWQVLGEVSQYSQYFYDTNLVCGPGFFYRVRAVNPGGASEPSNTIHTSVCPPSAPAALRVMAVTQDNITLSWEDTSDNEVGFKIAISRDQGAHWQVLTNKGMVGPPTTISNLACGTTYHFRVLAYNGSGSATSDSIAATTAACTVLYVDARASGMNSGTSWADAFTDLQSALATAARQPRTSNVQIWVASGTYKPTPSTDRAASFALINGSALYGGFAGDEVALEQRDWRANPTTLSGDIGVAGNMAS